MWDGSLSDLCREDCGGVSVTEKTKKVKAKADRLAELAAQKERVQTEIEGIKAWLKNLAVSDLKDTKKRTVECWGNSNARMVVGSSETVKPISMAMIKRLLDTVYPDFVTEKTNYSLTAPAKRLFTIAYLGAYTGGMLGDAIQVITKGEKLQRTLCKKLKGKYEKDTESLMKSAGLDAKEANDWACLVSEVVNWKWMFQVLKAAEWSGTPQEIVDIINAAVIVDESLKVAVGAEEKSQGMSAGQGAIEEGRGKSIRSIDSYQMKRIYAVGHQLSLVGHDHEGELHTLMATITGKESVRALSYWEAESVIARLTQLQGDQAPPRPRREQEHPSRPGGVTSGQQKKVWVLMYELAKYDRKPKSVSLGDRLYAIIKKKLGMDAIARTLFAWINFDSGSRLIEVLEGYVKSAIRGCKDGPVE